MGRFEVTTTVSYHNPEGQVVTRDEWLAKWAKTCHLRVAWDDIHGIEIRTSWSGRVAYIEGRPLFADEEGRPFFYRTRVRGGPKTIKPGDFYRTRDEALEGHRRFVEQITRWLEST